MNARTLRTTSRWLAICGAVAACAAGAGSGQEWPQWRGPSRDGTTTGMEAPASWPAKLARVWSVPVGEGHAGPLISGNTVYLHSREGEEETLRALDLRDGKTLWRQAWAVPYQMHMAARSHGKGPKSTPVLAAGRIYTVGITGTISAFDAETGRSLWTKEFSGQHKITAPLYGTAASPVVDRGLLIVHVGGHHSGTLAAFDAVSGDQRWGLKGDGPGYASPIVAELAGTRQVITQSDQRILGVSVEDGSLIWSTAFTTPYDQNAVTALVFEDMVIASGIEQGVHAYLLERRDGLIGLREAWARPEISMYMSSPVLAAGRLVGLSHKSKGQLFCLDPRTGRTLWTGPGGQGENAALVSAGDLVLVLTDAAELIVASARADEFKPLARYTVAESATWAHPAPAAKGILIKDKDHLTLWTWAAPAGSAG